MTMVVTAETVADLATQLDDLGWVLSAVCRSHVWHVTLTSTGASAVSCRACEGSGTMASWAGDEPADIYAAVRVCPTCGGSRRAPALVVTAEDRDWLTAVAAAVGEAHAYEARRAVRCG